MQIDLLGMDCVDCTSSVLITMEGKKIIFNCGEGLQRLSIEHKLKLIKIEAIFISQLDWLHIGGLPGILLTLSDGGMKELMLVGPKGLSVVISMMSSFLQRRGFKLNIQEVGQEDGKRFQLSNGISVDCFLGGSPSTPIANEEQLLREAAQVTSKMFLSNEAFKPHSYPESPNIFPSLSDNYFAFSQQKLQFVVETPSLPGTFDPQKAIQLGVPKGPLFGQLKSGNPVILANGSVVRPETCVGPEFKSKSFAYCEFEKQSEMHAFFAMHRKEYEQRNNIQFALMKTPTKLSFKGLDFFPKIFIVPSTLPVEFPVFGPLLFTSTAGIQEQMANVTNSEHFSTLHQENFGTFLDSYSQVEENVKLCHPFQQFVLHPSKDNSQNTEEFIGASNCCNFFNPSKDFIVFLGTGSALPSMYRNVSSFMVGFPGHEEYFLFDCGEGTFGQLCRKFGSNSKRVCQSLRAIFLSHLHADHHLGTIKFLQSCINGDNPITVFAPSCLIDWLSNYSKFEGGISRYINYVTLEPGKRYNFNELYPATPSKLEFEFIPVPVLHCHDSFGFVVNFFRDSSATNSSFRIAYSGDTLPCPLFNATAEGSDIFVHEATFDDSLAEEASLRQHCTITQAIKSFSESKSKYAILTHFSQRYPKFPELVESSHRVSLAFDGMHAMLDNLESLQAYEKDIESFFMTMEHQ